MAAAAEDGAGPGSLEDRPGVFLIGSPNVGKRTLLSRLLSIDFPETSDLSSGILCQGWTIETKYYSADISIWTTNLHKGLSFRTLPFSKQLVALVMVFDLNDESSFTALQDWVVSIDLKKFDILLCIGNKADLVSGHDAHVEYRRYLQKHGESSSDPHPEYMDYGINESEAISLLGGEEPALGIRKLCSEWCTEYNIEFIEACASNTAFDKCLSIDGDIQGLERLAGALSAHMWPGMILKSGNMISASYQITKEEMTDEDSDYEIEYEVLSRGSDEPWDFVGESDISFNESPTVNPEDGFAEQVPIRHNQDINHAEDDERAKDINHAEDDINHAEDDGRADDINHAEDDGRAKDINHAEDDGRAKDLASTSEASSALLAGDQDQNEERDGPVKEVSTSEVEILKDRVSAIANRTGSDGDTLIGVDDLEKMMCDISGMRDNLRLMPDFQRREMAAKLAMKMAAMFDESSDEEGFE